LAFLALVVVVNKRACDTGNFDAAISISLVAVRANQGTDPCRLGLDRIESYGDTLRILMSSIICRRSGDICRLRLLE